MRSLAPKKEETEFDDLLGQLVDELAMTPASESAVSVVPEIPPVHVDNTEMLAAQAAAAAHARMSAPPRRSNAVMIAAILATAISAVAITAMIVFADNQPAAEREVAASVPEPAPAPVEPKVELPPPVVVQPLVTPPVPEPVVTPVVTPEKPKPKPKVRKPKPKPDTTSIDSDFDQL